MRKIKKKKASKSKIIKFKFDNVCRKYQGKNNNYEEAETII